MKRFFHFLVFLCILITQFFTSVEQAIANTQGVGRVNMQGTIIAAACAISPSSFEQAIHMTSIPIANIVRNGKSHSKPLTIELINCKFERTNSGSPSWKYFQVTFDGDADGKLFGVRGESKGVALEMTNSQGATAMPGTPLPNGDITLGNMLLHYSIKLVVNNQILQAGSYYSTVRFKLDYY